METIRVGMIRCDLHAAWYALLMAPVDEAAVLKYYAVNHHYFYTSHNLRFERIPGFAVTKVWDAFPRHGGFSHTEDGDLSNAEIFAGIFTEKPEICDSPEEVSDDVDMVFIADCMDEGKDHMELAAPGLKKGVPTFVDKPFAYTLDDARAMIKLAEDNKTAVMSSSLLRQNPLTESFMSRFAEIAPVGEGFIKGVGLGNLGAIIHGLSLAQHVFGEGVEWVDCMGQIPLEIVRLHYPSTHKRVPKGVEVVVLSSNLVGPDCGYQCVVYGRNGAIVSPWINDYNFPLGGRRIVQMCAEMVRTRKPQVPYAAMLELIAVVEAARKSQETGGQPVYLKEL